MGRSGTGPPSGHLDLAVWHVDCCYRAVRLLTRAAPTEVEAWLAGTEEALVLNRGGVK